MRTLTMMKLVSTSRRYIRRSACCWCQAWHIVFQSYRCSIICDVPFGVMCAWCIFVFSIAWPWYCVPRSSIWVSLRVIPLKIACLHSNCAFGAAGTGLWCHDVSPLASCKSSQNNFWACIILVWELFTFLRSLYHFGECIILVCGVCRPTETPDVSF